MIKTYMSGRMVKKPELFNYNDKQGVVNTGCRFTVAADNYPNDVEYMDCVIFGKRAQSVEKYFDKGDQIFVAGRLCSNTYEKDGVKRKSWSVTVEEYEFGAKKGGAAASGSAPSVPSTPADTDDMPF